VKAAWGPVTLSSADFHCQLTRRRHDNGWFVNQRLKLTEVGATRHEYSLSVIVHRESSGSTCCWVVLKRGPLPYKLLLLLLLLLLLMLLLLHSTLYANVLCAMRIYSNVCLL